MAQNQSFWPWRFRRWLFGVPVIAVGTLLLSIVGEALVGARLESFRDRVIVWSDDETADDDRLGFVFLNVDDATQAAAGAAVVTPRADLATLIGFAVEHARLVIVDVDLTPSDATTSALRDQLSALAARKGGHVLVVDEIRWSASDELPRRMPTPYDDVLARATSLHRSVPAYERDQDGTVRYARLWQPICVGDTGEVDGGAPVVRPSTALLAATMLQSSDPAGALAAVREALQPLQPRTCRGASEDGNEPISIVVDDWALRAAPTRPRHRIRYRFPWRSTDGPHTARQDGTAFSMLEVVPAHRITHARQDVSPDLFAGRVVVIGGSHGGDDFHDTPIGPMPGAVLLINAIDSLVRHPDDPGLSWPSRIARIVVVSAIIASVAATLRPGVYGLVVLAGAVLSVLVLPSRSLLSESAIIVLMALVVVSTVRSLCRLSRAASDLRADYRRDGFAAMLNTPDREDRDEQTDAVFP